MPKIVLPGSFWSTLLIAATYFLTANFDGAPWYAGAMAVIMALVKYLEGAATTTPAAQSRSLTPDKAQPGKFTRWFFGG